MTALSELKQQRSDEAGILASIPSGLFYLLIGGGVGAATALLLAPKSGADLRHDISDLTRKGYDETRELAHEMKEHSTDLYQSFRNRADTVLDLAAAKFAIINEAEENLAESGMNESTDVKPTSAKNKWAHKGPGRRSAGIV